MFSDYNFADLASIFVMQGFSGAQPVRRVCSDVAWTRYYFWPDGRD